MKAFLYCLVQCTWGILQTLVGTVIFLILIRNRHYSYKGSIVTEWSNTTSASIGMFIFITAPEYMSRRSCRSERYNRLLVHEYGHTIQSLVLGPLYLLLVGLPSSLWCNLPACKMYRKKNRVSYYSFFTERSADNLGERVTGRRSMGC